MRRGLALFLSVVMLFSFIPSGVEGSSFAKDISALFGDFQLKVNGKEVPNHKELFLYDENLFASLSDLSRGLDMEINIRGNTVNLSSKGKLNPKSDSNQPIVFQRGYEISAKERIIESLEDEVRMLNGKSPAGINYNMVASLKNIKVGFGKTSIYLDGKKINLDTEILNYKSDFYVALDSIAPYLYITPSMSKDKTTINIHTNSVLVSDNTYSTIDALLSMREGRNYLLDLQRAEIERKKYLLEEFKLPYKKITTIASLEDYLNKNFKTIGEIDVVFDVVQQSNWINLDISFPRAKNPLWRKLRRSDVEQWIWRVYTAVLQLYDEEAIISGVVRNPYYTHYSNSDLKNYVTFYTKDSDIYFDFTKSNLVADNKTSAEGLLEMLNKDLSKYLSIGLSYDAKMTGSSVELIVYPSTDNFNKLSLFMKMGYLKSLNQKVKVLYPDLAIDGQIVYLGDILPIDFYISENRIRSINLLEETEKHIKNNFGSFSYGNSSFRMDYSLAEKDLKNYHLTVKTDFSVDDEKWIKSGDNGKQRLSSNIHNALSFVLSLWEANVSTEIVDKNGVLITDFDVYQENVSLVTATPDSGEIVEGEKVYLYTDTVGASIYYTLDGSTPTTSSHLYDGQGIVITEDTEINAFGYKEGLGAGLVSTFRYTILRNENISYGLTNLTVDPGTLDTPFSNTKRRYTVDLSRDIDAIDITPYATAGVITVNGDTVSTGETISISLNGSSTTISISVKEANKAERIYTVVVNRDGGGNITTFDMADLKFNTLFGLIFSGKIISNNVNDFSGYKVELLTKSGVLKETVDVDGSGNFSFPNISLSPIDKIIGFKYIVYDNTGKDILKRNLN